MEKRARNWYPFMLSRQGWPWTKGRTEMKQKNISNNPHPCCFSSVLAATKPHAPLKCTNSVSPIWAWQGCIANSHKHLSVKSFLYFSCFTLCILCNRHTEAHGCYSYMVYDNPLVNVNNLCCLCNIFFSLLC